MTDINMDRNDATTKDELRIHIMMALETAKTLDDKFLLYLLRMALEQLDGDTFATTAVMEDHASIH